MTVKYFITFLFLLPTVLFGQTRQELTATQIIDSSLVFCGGEQRISKITSTKINYLLNQPDNSTAIINEQRITGKKYVQSILSKTNNAQTTFFNGEKVSRVDGNSILHSTEIKPKNEIWLKTYSLVQYGYKQLKYKLDRLPDQKFSQFECFVLKATGDNGYETLNFFDKSNFRLLMVVYPNGNKSLMIDYVFKDSVLFNSHIINTFANSDKMQTFRLQTIDLNPTISDIWFNCPYSDKLEIPDFIKKGKFVSSSGVKTNFARTETTMEYKDEKGNLELRRFLAWGTTDTFGLMDEKALREGDKSSKSQILVRIVSWDNNGYVCQWITDTHTDTQDYKLVR